MFPYVPPTFNIKGFNCPHCNAYANHDWQEIFCNSRTNSNIQFDTLKRAVCPHCDKYSIWHSEKIIYPESTGVPLPNPDLQDDIKEDYLEAANILNKSPRGATALLRLCIQKLCKQLGEKGENINNDIRSLVKKGLPPLVQQSLDYVRVIGNNAVHPGQIDLKDDRKTALNLFECINLVAQIMITQPKEIQQLYSSLPQEKREAIDKQDTP